MATKFEQSYSPNYAVPILVPSAPLLESPTITHPRYTYVQYPQTSYTSFAPYPSPYDHCHHEKTHCHKSDTSCCVIL